MAVVQVSRYSVEISGDLHDVELIEVDGQLWAKINGNRHKVGLTPDKGNGRYTLSLNERKIPMALTANGRGYELYVRGKSFDVRVERASIRAMREHLRSSDAAAGDVGVVESHMPGLIAKILAKPGQQVAQGDALFVIEAMKMENEVRAPFAGVVDSIAVEEGKEVSGGATLCILKPESSDD